MRNLLYISPYFPPATRVGALRPLKFTRHLATHGWRAVVLCDLGRGEALDPELSAAVGAGTVIVRDYASASARAERRDRAPPAVEDRRERQPVTAWHRLAQGVRRRVARVNPELVPLGAHSLDVPHAIAAALRCQRRYDCDAILVNADPFAALWVGAVVAERCGRPLLVDLRDPWAVCELRRPLRPRFQRGLVDRLERYVVERAQRVILNTETARDAYLAHYPDLPASRFVALRNHADPELVSAGPPQPRAAAFTLLYLGHLRRFVEGGALLALLVELRRRGHGPSAARLRVVGTMPGEIRAALLAVVGAAWACGLDDPRGAADVVEALIANGRGAQVSRAPLGITSAEATAVLAGWLDEAVSANGSARERTGAFQR